MSTRSKELFVNIEHVRFVRHRLLEVSVANFTIELRFDPALVFKMIVQARFRLVNPATARIATLISVFSVDR